MKKGILYIIASILLISVIAFGDSKDLGSLCEELLIKRAEAWNKIFTEDYNYEMFYDDVNAIASGKLLEEDLEIFIYLKEYPTDMERVISLDFTWQRIEKSGSNAVLEGKILWNLEGQESFESMEGYYRIEMMKHKGNWYLLDFQPIE